MLAFLASLLGCAREPVNVESKADYHYQLATNLFYDQNPHAAMTELYQAIEFEADHARAHHLLGFIFFGRRDWDRSMEHLTRAVELDPDYDVAVANMGNLLLALERWAEAKPYFERLLKKPLYRTPYLAYNNLGWAAFNLGQLDEAIKAYEMALFLNPKFCLAHNNLGRLFAQQGETKRALEAFEKAVELCPKYAEPHYFLGRIFAALQAPARAAQHFTSCRDLAPESPYGIKCKEAL